MKPDLGGGGGGKGPGFSVWKRKVPAEWGWGMTACHAEWAIQNRTGLKPHWGKDLRLATAPLTPCSHARFPLTVPPYADHSDHSSQNLSRPTFNRPDSLPSDKWLTSQGTSERFCLSNRGFGGTALVQEGL